MAKGIQTQAPLKEQHRSTFTLGNRAIGTLDFGRLQPIKCMEVVPGDVVELDIKGYTQLAPNAAPICGDIEATLHAFYVPNRIIWKKWNEYITGLNDTSLPYVQLSKLNGHTDASTGLMTDSLWGDPETWTDQTVGERDVRAIANGLGLNTYTTTKLTSNTVGDIPITIFPFMAYNRIWWDWYRNKNIIGDDQIGNYGINDTNAIVEGSSTDGYAWMRQNFKPRYRCFEKDYVTSALKTPAGEDSSGNKLVSTAVSMGFGSPQEVADRTLNTYSLDGRNGLSNGNRTSITQIRVANALQKWLESANYLGKQVISRLNGMFAGNATPERLDMSEYLGGNTSTVKFQNSSASVGTADDDTDVNAFGATDRATKSMMGQVYSQGTVDFSLHTSPYHVNEHGYIIVIASIMPKPQYYTALDRMWTRGVGTPDRSRFDFFTSEFENIGMQPVYKHEVLVPQIDIEGRTISNETFDPLQIFGYQPKYMDYKFSHDRLFGDFLNPETRLTMQQYHLGRDFEQEYGIFDATGHVSAEGEYADITLENTAEAGQAVRTIYDGKFTVPNSRYDHFITDFKIGVTASRPMQSNNIPAIDTSEISSNNKMLTLGGVRL